MVSMMWTEGLVGRMTRIDPSFIAVSRKEERVAPWAWRQSQEVEGVPI